MSNSEFSYVIYIRATRDQVWAGLTEPEFTRKYWMHDNISDWKAGSRWEHKRSDDSGTVDIVGEVVQCDSPHRLVITWAKPEDEGNPEKTSRVAFEIALQEGWPGATWTRLRIAHTDLEPNSGMLHDISLGWPTVASGLKTVLECGRFGDKA